MFESVMEQQRRRGGEANLCPFTWMFGFTACPIGATQPSKAYILGSSQDLVELEMFSFTQRVFIMFTSEQERPEDRELGDRASNQDPPDHDLWVIIETAGCASVFHLSPVQESFFSFPELLISKKQ